jgi:FAD/FMN-containing dehydrogenase
MAQPRLIELERAIDGDVVVEGSHAFDRLPKPFNARFDDTQPDAVVRCTSAGDVAETISFVRRHGLRMATRSGGHCFAGRSTTSGILIDVSPIRSVAVSDGLVRVGAGARLGEVYVGTMRHGLAIPGGTCPSVGIAGLALGGGLGILGRTYGVTSDRLVGALVVLADGQTVACDEHHDEALFWALRGAGTGHFGVVTDLVFDPVRGPTAAASFHLTWPFASAAAVAEAWMRWSPSGPDELAASMVLGASGDPDEVPTVEVFGTMLGTGSDAREQLEGLLVGVPIDPTTSFLEEMSYEDTLRYWAARAGEELEDPRAEPAAREIHLVRSEFFERPLPTEVLSALLERFAQDRAAGQSRELDLSPWGGAYSRVQADATAFVHREPLFWIKHAVVLPPEANAGELAAAHGWVTASWSSVHPWGTGGVFPNFPDPDLEDWAHAYYGANLARLLRVKARYDPENIFRFRQSLPLP